MGEVSEQTASEPRAAQRMDDLPLTRLHLALVLACGIGLALDTFEIAFGSILAAVFSTPPNRLASGDLGLLLAAVYVGAAVGAPLVGWIADRQGRRNVLVGILLWIAMTSVAAALSQSVEALTLCRCLAGIALGAYPPTAIAYMTDVLPPRHRGLMVFAGLSPAALGPPLAIFLVRAMSQPAGLDAWRWGLVVGAVSCVVVAAVFAALPESPRWLAARGYEARTEAMFRRFARSPVLAGWPPIAPAPVTTQHREVDAYAGGSTRSRWLGIGALFVLSPWSTVTFSVLVGAVLGQRGFKLSETLLLLGLGTIGPLIGTLLTASVVDRFERRRVLAACALGMTAATGVFVMSEQPAFLTFALGLCHLFASLYLPPLNLYGAELFPTAKRASSMAIAWALNRVGAALGPLLLVPVLREAGPAPMFIVIAATLVASLLVLAVSPVGRQLRAVG